jgi:transposase
MRDTNLRLISDDERNTLYGMMQEDADDGESGYRAKIILLKDEGYTVPEIRVATNHHDTNIRKWIHRFNEQGIEGITSKIHIHKPIKVTTEMEKQIVEIATKNPREGYGLPFSTWSLRVLAGYISKEINLVNSISHTQIRNILIKHGIRYRRSKTTLGNSQDPEYHLKKRELKI